MKYQIAVLKQVENDMKEIIEYYRDMLKEPETAARIYEMIIQKFYSLETMPQRCRIVSEPPYAQMGIRRLLVGNYVIFYRVVENRKTVYIHRVLHHRRQWQDILGDLYVN